MKASRLLLLIAFWTTYFGGTKILLAQVTDTFKVVVPVKGIPVGGTLHNTDVVPIGQIKAVVSLTSNDAVTFRITDQANHQHDFGPCGPLPSTCAGANPQTFGPPENNGAAADKVTVMTSPTEAPSAGGDPTRYEIQFQLNSNHPDSDCHTTQTAQNSYTVQVISSAARITGVCLESFDGHFRTTPPSNSCTNTDFARNIITTPSSSPDIEATVDPNGQPTFACYKTRPPVDVVMVLDKSGSMDITDSGVGKTRMQALKDAVGTFLDTSAAIPPANDQVSIVSFSTTATSATPFRDVVTDKNNINADVNMLSAGGSTSMGSGLLAAKPMLTPTTGRRKVVLLMSDGQQNTDPMVDGPPVNTAGLITTYCATDPAPCGAATVPTAQTSLFSDASIQPQFYPVTVGPSINVPAAIDQRIANATHGFYLNTEMPLSLLDPFFVQLLQNFVRFNSYETVRLISENISPTKSYSAIVPIWTTSHDAVFSLTWPKQFGMLRLTVTPPGGAQPIVREGASGLISLVEPLPPAAPFDPRGDWRIQIEMPTATGISTVTTTNGSDIPFNLHLMTDDAAIKAELAVVPGDYKVGDKIGLHAKLTYFGSPILGLGPNAGRQIKVDLIKPGESVGDMLSDSTASSLPPASNPDLQQGAEAKLFNVLQSNPSLLKHDEQKGIALYDDGKPEHGDDVAGDGIYSALYPAILPGHYNFLFSVESTDWNSVRFSRQQLRTAFVRAVPDTDNTVIRSSIVRGDGGGVLSMVLTPRFKAGPGCVLGDPKCGRMGPGWANYFWFTAAGHTPFKATDNLDGTYTATLNFTGATPPSVSVHFEDVLAIIGDAVTPDHLPQPLGLGNSFAHFPNCCGTSNKFAFFLDAGAGIPNGTFSSAVNTGFSFNTGVEYIANNHFSMEGIFGYHHVPGASPGSLNLYQFSVNGKTYLTSGALRPFVNFGIGAYKFSPGTTKFGGNVGTGVFYRLTSRVGLEGVYDFHVVNTPGGATKFSTLQGGVRFYF